MRFEDAQEIVYLDLRRAGLSLRRGGRFEDAERLSAQPEPEFNEENASCAYIRLKQAHGSCSEIRTDSGQLLMGFPSCAGDIRLAPIKSFGGQNGK